MKLALDTSGYSRLMQSHSELTNVIERADHVYVPAITMGELYAGFRIGSRFEINQSELLEFVGLPGVEIVSVDHGIAERYGILVDTLKRNGTPIPTNDIWIAATALEYGARLVTYDIHFQFVYGLITLAP